MVPSGNVQTCHIAALRAELALGMVCCGAAFSSVLLGNRSGALRHSIARAAGGVSVSTFRVYGTL